MGEHAAPDFAEAAGDCMGDVLASILRQVRKRSMENIVQDNHALEQGLIDFMSSTAELCNDAECMNRRHVQFLPIPEFNHDFVLITSDSIHLSHVKDSITLCVLSGH